MRPIKTALATSTGNVSAKEGKLECDKAESPIVFLLELTDGHVSHSLKFVVNFVNL
jgi:hypothetical protein